MNYKKIKLQLEEDLLITQWNPSDLQLKKIIERISILKEIDKPAVSLIIHDIYGEHECMISEGIDDSDLTTLLKLASNSTNND